MENTEFKCRGCGNSFAISVTLHNIEEWQINHMSIAQSMPNLTARERGQLVLHLCEWCMIDVQEALA